MNDFATIFRVRFIFESLENLKINIPISIHWLFPPILLINLFTNVNVSYTQHQKAQTKFLRCEHFQQHATQSRVFVFEFQSRAASRNVFADCAMDVERIMVESQESFIILWLWCVLCTETFLYCAMNPNNVQSSARLWFIQSNIQRKFQIIIMFAHDIMFQWFTILFRRFADQQIFFKHIFQIIIFYEFQSDQCIKNGAATGNRNFIDIATGGSRWKCGRC